MKNLRKTFLLIFAIIALCVCFVFSASALEESGKLGDNVTYTYNSETKEVVISGEGDMWDFIPHSGTNNPPFWGEPEAVEKVVIEDGVTGIGNETFVICEKLTEITIPDSITKIGKNAFAGCTLLKNITLPDSITSIGETAFNNCTSIESITIPKNITTINYGTFFCCESIKSIIMPDGVEVIDEKAFYYCESLEEITIPGSVTSLGEGIFSGCKKLKSIVIPDSVDSIGRDIFMGCTGLTDVQIGNGITSIPVSAFLRCSSIKNIIIPENVISIEYGAFANCTGLESVTLSNKTKTIDNAAFEGCTSLEKVFIPASVEKLHNCAFMLCDNLKSIIVDADNSFYSNDASGVLFNKEKTTLIFCPGGDGKTEYIVTDGVNNIMGGAFRNCTNLTSVTIPVSVMKIGFGVFSYPTDYSGNEEHTLTDIYYCGTRKEWENITIEDGNKLDYINIHFKEHEHKFTLLISVAPDCINDGYEQFVCECGNSFTKTTKALGHSLSLWVTDYPSTCNSTGRASRYCTLNCGYTEYKDLPLSSHSMSGWTEEYPATCTEEGLMSRYCTNYCGYTETQIVDPTGHRDDDGDGYCDNCGADLRQENCSCNCHKGGFVGFIWKILSFFQKLFKTNRYCACGAAHW